MSQLIPESTAKQFYAAEEIQAWLVSYLSEQLGIEPDDLDVREPLDSYGLDSQKAMILASKAEKLLGFHISPILLWHYPTIEALSKRLAEEEVPESEIFEI